MWILTILFLASAGSQLHAQAGIKSRSRMDDPAVTFNVFPNPNTGKFTVTVKDPEESYHINVYNLIGQMVYHWESDDASSTTLEINLSKQPKGVYLVELDTERANMIKKVLVDNEKGN